MVGVCVPPPPTGMFSSQMISGCSVLQKLVFCLQHNVVASFCELLSAHDRHRSQTCYNKLLQLACAKIAQQQLQHVGTSYYVR